MANAHKQALVNHASIQSSLKTMSASVHEAEVLLNAAAIDLDEPGARASCLPDDDPRVESIGEHTTHQTLTRTLTLTLTLTLNFLLPLET